MKLILEYLATDGFFLFKDHKCRITASRYIEAWDGVGHVILETDNVRLRFRLERRNIILYCQAVNRDPADEGQWYSIGLVREMLTGEQDMEFQPVVVSYDPPSATMETWDEGSRFLQQHFSAIETRFHPSRRAETEKQLERLKDERAERRYG